MGVPEVLEAFHQYTENEIPFRLIDLDNMCLVDREMVRQAYAPSIEAIIDKDIEQHTSYANQRRQDVIQAIVRGVVKYAILSHTWISGELLFRDMTLNSRPSGAGWDKLVRFCETSKHSFKCRFAWADTVCVDLTCSTEVQESTESAFRWFRNAYICIAYVAGSTDLSDLKEDRWFTRGWTLLELLAPMRMKFYGADWKPLNNPDIENDKADRIFLNLISEISQIPVDDLRSYWPGPDRVRMKLSWASSRNTSRVEDKAYSLMAIFDARIPVAYGEGERAFSRLMLDIIPRCGECDVFAWAGPSSADHPYIPRSPQGYGYHRLDSQLNSDAHYYRLSGDRALSSDLAGLGMRVVVIEVTPPRAIAGYLRDYYTPRSRTHKTSISEVTLLEPKRFKKKIKADLQMAVGVIDYRWTNRLDEGRLVEGDKYFCFLLHRHSGQWQKVHTKSVVFLVSKENVVQKLDTLYLHHHDN